MRSVSIFPNFHDARIINLTFSIDMWLLGLSTLSIVSQRCAFVSGGIEFGKFSWPLILVWQCYAAGASSARAMCSVESSVVPHGVALEKPEMF